MELESWQCSCSSLSDFKFHSCKRDYFAVNRILNQGCFFEYYCIWLGGNMNWATGRNDLQFNEYWSFWLLPKCIRQYCLYFHASSVKLSTGTSSGLIQSHQQVPVFEPNTFYMHCCKVHGCFNQSDVYAGDSFLPLEEFNTASLWVFTQGNALTLGSLVLDAKLWCYLYCQPV
jgi:hypothetical protein